MVADAARGGGRQGERDRRAGVKILADEVFPIAEAQERLVRAVHLQRADAGAGARDARAGRRASSGSTGAPCPVYLHLVTPQHSETVLKAGGGCQVRPAPEFVRGLEQLLGKDAVTLR